MLLIFVDLSRLAQCHFFPMAFLLSQLNATTGGEFKLMNSSGIVYPLPFNAIGKPFLVSIYLFCSLSISPNVIIFFKLCLATTIAVLKPASCDHVTSFNYNGKKTRNVGLTFWCHLGNIMPDSMFHKSMKEVITVFLFCFGLFFFCCKAQHLVF